MPRGKRSRYKINSGLFAHADFDLQNLIKGFPALNVSVLTDTELKTNNPVSANSVRPEIEASDAPAISNVSFQLGLWFSGLQSFLQIRNYSFASKGEKSGGRDWIKEFYLTNSALLLCSKFTLQLIKLFELQKNSSAQAETEKSYRKIADFDFEDASNLSEMLKHLILMNEMLLRSAPSSFSEWMAWSNILSEKLKQSEIVQKAIRQAESEGEKFLPATLQEILQNKSIPAALEADLRIVLPRIARILKWLDVIGQMLKKDEPLKPSLLLFSRIYEQTQEMTKYINNRLLRFADENDPIFGALDCAVYAASIESRKVYTYELAGLTEIRQTPQVYAKIETAHGLLNDSFQQTLVNFAQLVEPSIEPRKLFPNFQTKLEQSLALRRELWNVQQTVQKAEHDPHSFSVENLQLRLSVFVKGNMRFLMFKDCETVERFVEEILRTKNRQDLVPILHRFGAYIETLLGQVNMRTVLANHPFEYPKE